MKIVVTDMDGTLLNTNKELDEDFLSIIEPLKKLGVKVGIASGRQYEILKKYFKGYDNDLILIADNGSVINVDGEFLDIKSLDKDIVKEIVNAINRVDGLYAVLCGINGSYINTYNETVIKNAQIYCHNMSYFENIDDIFTNDRIIKIAAYDLDKNIANKISLFDNFKSKVNVVQSAVEWLDFMVPGINKGVALKRIKDIYNLSHKDCVVFGDYDNDIEILNEAYYSYAMKNANDNVKRVANFTCESNDECGVSRTIKRLFNI